MLLLLWAILLLTCESWHPGGRLPGNTAPGFTACCGCLQFDKTCNCQYLGVA